MFINTSRQYTEGAVLNLSFCLALSGLEVHARGEVRCSLPGVGVQFIDIPENAIHSIEREIQLSRRTPSRPARKVTWNKSKGHKLNRKLTRRKRAKSKATPRKPRKRVPGLDSLSSLYAIIS
jgi:hypothetical protein